MFGDSHCITAICMGIQGAKRSYLSDKKCMHTHAKSFLLSAIKDRLNKETEIILLSKRFRL